MPRRKVVAKREILPDPKYGDVIVSKFINQVMVSGKKSIAERIVYGAFVEVMQRAKNLQIDRKALQEAQDAFAKPVDGDDNSGDGDIGSGAPVSLSAATSAEVVKFFLLALKNTSPVVEVKSRRVGGSTYQVPIQVRAARSLALAMRWLVDAAKQRSEKTMVLRLAHEILDAMVGRGGAVKKREDTHRMAKANQAFAHYRW